MSMTRSRRGAISYVVVAAIALALGAAGFVIWRQQDDLATGEAGTGWVWIASGEDSVRAYVTYPDRETRAPAIIVIHENQGLTPWEPTVADRLAGYGYVAIVPDLLSSSLGQTPDDRDSARAAISELDPERVTADLNATFAWLQQNSHVRPTDIATIGFCWGGGQSFRYATNNPALRAAVVCYGPAPDTQAMSSIKAPVLGIYAENDARINAARPAVQDRLRRLGKRFITESYPGTGHGFLKPGRMGSDGPEPERAWTRILNFYRETLGR